MDGTILTWNTGFFQWLATCHIASQIFAKWRLAAQKTHLK
jgi:hypothetical protein